MIKRLSERSAIRGPILGWWQWAPCAANRSASTDSYTGPWDAETSNPLLLIGNIYDSNTPYSGAVNAEKAPGNAVLLTLATYGHPSYNLPSQCLDAATVRYLVDLVTPPPGTVCATDQVPFQPAAQP